jgi:DNA-binding MarR family transcriptional regulator
MIQDQAVLQILERRDLKPNEKLVLLDILAREPKPEKEEKNGVTVLTVGMAKVTREQIVERTGLSESTVKGVLKVLVKRNLLDKKGTKGRVPNLYRVNLSGKSKSNKKEKTA